MSLKNYQRKFFRSMLPRWTSHLHPRLCTVLTISQNLALVSLNLSKLFFIHTNFRLLLPTESSTYPHLNWFQWLQSSLLSCQYLTQLQHQLPRRSLRQPRYRLRCQQLHYVPIITYSPRCHLAGKTLYSGDSRSRPHASQSPLPSCSPYVLNNLIASKK